MQAHATTARAPPNKYAPLIGCCCWVVVVAGGVLLWYCVTALYTIIVCVGGHEHLRDSATSSLAIGACRLYGCTVACVLHVLRCFALPTYTLALAQHPPSKFRGASRLVVIHHLFTIFSSQSTPRLRERQASLHETSGVAVSGSAPSQGPRPSAPLPLHRLMYAGGGPWAPLPWPWLSLLRAGGARGTVLA